MKPRYWRLIRYALAAAGALVLVMQLGTWLPNHMRRGHDGMDFAVYHAAAQNLVAGRPVYDSERRADLTTPPTSFLYPPTALALLRPAGHIDLGTFQRIWYPLLVVAFWAFAAALARLLTQKLTVVDTLAAGALLWLTPNLDVSMSFGNVDVIVWALVAWAFAAPPVTACLLTIAAAIKLYPFGALVVVMLRDPRRPRQVLQASATALGLVVIALAATNRGTVHEWLSYGVPAVNAGCFHPGNLSLSTALLRLFDVDAKPVLPTAAKAFLALAPVVATASAVVLLRRLPLLPHAALVLVVTLVAGPIFWTSYLPILWIPIVVSIAALLRQREPRRTSEVAR